MLCFLGRPCPPLPCPADAVSFMSLASLSMSVLRSVIRAAMLSFRLLPTLDEYWRAHPRGREAPGHWYAQPRSLHPFPIPVIPIQLLQQLCHDFHRLHIDALCCSERAPCLRGAAAQARLQSNALAHFIYSASLCIVLFVLQTTACDHNGCSALTVSLSIAPSLLTLPLQPYPTW